MDKIRRQLLQDLVEKFGQAIKRLHTGHNFPFGDFNLSRQEVLILFSVAETKDGAAIKDLTKRLGVTPGAITQFTDSLVKKGLVLRQEDPSDRRTISIRLTDNARQHFDKFRKHYFKSVSLAFSDFRSADLEKFIFLLNKIIEPKADSRKR